MQLNNMGRGYGTPSQIIGELNAYQANLDPNSAEFQGIEQRKVDLMNLASQNNPSTFQTNAPPPNAPEPGEGTPSQIIAELNAYQANLDPNSADYKSIENRKQALLGLSPAGNLSSVNNPSTFQTNAPPPNGPAPGYGTPSQIVAELNAYQANLDPNSADYKSIENRKQALLGQSPVGNNNQTSILGQLIGIMSMLVQALFGMSGSKS